MDFDLEFAEGDVAAVVREDAVVGHGVDHGAGGARVPLLGGDVFRPVAVVAGFVGWD